MKHWVLSEVQESNKQLKDELLAAARAQLDTTHTELKQLIATSVSDADTNIRRESTQNLDMMVDKLVAARDVKLRTAEVQMKAHVADQIAQHLAVTNLEITEEQKEALQQEITANLQTHFQTQWDPNYTTIEDNFMEIAGVTNEIIKCLRAKCSDNPRVSCWSVLSASTGTTKLSKIARNWNLPNDDAGPAMPPSQAASQAAGSAKNLYVNPMTDAPTPMASNTPYIPTRPPPGPSQPVRPSPRFSPHMGQREPSPGPSLSVLTPTGRREHYQEINHGDSRFTKLNSFPLKLTDISLAVPWYKLFKDKCEYHGIYIPALDEYDVNKPYGTKIPQQMIDNPALLTNHACAIRALLHHDMITSPEFRADTILPTENGYQSLYRIMERCHPKINPNITTDPPVMTTTSGTQHVQAILSYLELMRIGSKISYVDALRKAFFTFTVSPYEQVQNQATHIPEDCYDIEDLPSNRHIH
jgi:hypothetical protein